MFCRLAICLSIGMVLLLPWPMKAQEDPLHLVIEEQLSELDLAGIRAFLADLEPEVRELLPPFDVRRIVRGEGFADLGEIMLALLRYLWGEVFLQTRLMGQLIVLVVLCSLLQNLQRGLPAGASELAFAVCMAVLTVLALQSFHSAAQVGSRTIDSMVSFMQALLPTMATLLVAVGAVSSAAIFSPLLLAVTTTVGTLVEGIIFPLIFVAAVLGVAGNFSAEFPLSRLAGLVRTGCIALLGVVFSLFLGVMVVRGAIAPVADGAALRTAKFLTGTFVPVIGGMFADAVEVVVGGSLLIKNTIGALGLAAVGLTAAFPMMKIASAIILYRLVAAMVQPISEPRLTQALGSMADSLTLLFVAVGTVALMFFVAITMIIGIGNLAAFAR
ncbi:MAG: stage III sporulation protein AE [Firmicutes bacterium]|nr:stage III sporulation protein AE [Bacillota bacterium]